MGFPLRRYLHKPYLISGSKFDLRIYVYVTSYYPLRVYLFSDGLVRFASCKYVTVGPGPPDHLTVGRAARGHQTDMEWEFLWVVRGKGEEWGIRRFPLCLAGEDLAGLRWWRGGVEAFLNLPAFVELRSVHLSFTA